MVVAAKKYKLFKVCKELNVGIETISSFLSEKGIAVKGPNTSFSEDIYNEILDNFAREKEIADQLHLRKQHDSEDMPLDFESAEEEVSVEKSPYIQSIERSIEERLEAMRKKEKESEEEVEEQPAIEAEPPVEPVEQIVVEEPVEEPSEQPSQVIRTIELPIEDKKPAKKSKKTAAKKAESKPEEVTLEPEIVDTPKEKEEPKRTKEDKRRKAMEMIRKDEKRKKHMIRTGDLETIDSARRQRTKKARRKTVDQKEVQQTVKKTLANIDDKLRRTKKRKKIKTENGEVVEENVIYASEFISASDLANLMDVPVGDIIKKCLELGLVVSINQRLDLDTIELLAGEWDYSVLKEEEYAADLLDEFEEEEDSVEDTQPRAPIVTIMGHVDHGKTSLLDYIRKSKVVEGESGGITQHIGAYEVVKNKRKITFLDTPGHEAFTAMRARGAQITDIVILVIAADDDVKPQTDEAIDHARAAGVKMIVAINKIDKPEANPERVKQQLSERNILVEDWGGEFQCAAISAKTGDGIEELLEKVLLEAELLDLRATDTKKARGTVIESQLDKGKGVISTVLVQNGILKVGDSFIAGQFSGKVRALLNEKDKKIKQAGPSQPVQVLGFDGLPQAGDKFMVMADEQTVREISARRQRIKREQDFRQIKLRTLDQISENIKIGGVKELRIVVKADVDGSAEALADSLLKLSTQEVSVQVIRKAVGPISESDVLLAAASDAIVIGFHVRPNLKAKDLAAQETIEIRIYKVVYDAINDVKLALEGLLGTEEEEETIGSVEIRETFKISRLGTIAGCYVLNGKITRNSKIRLIRDDSEVYDGSLVSLKRFKDDVKEVAAGFECGLQIQNYNDLKVGDVIEAYVIVERKRTLDTA
jgi:translation initiation factor IF-2